MYFRYKGQNDIKQITYDSIKDLFLSDHRPVFSQLIISFKKENRVNIFRKFVV